MDVVADDVSFKEGGGCQTKFGETPQAKMGVSGNNFVGDLSRLLDEGPYLVPFFRQTDRKTLATLPLCHKT